MKAMDPPGAPMISVPAGVLKDFISNNPSSLLISNKSSTPSASPPRSLSPDGEKSRDATENQNHVQNGESENDTEKLNLPTSISITSEKVPVNVNGTKRPLEDSEQKLDLKKIRVFSEEKSKNVDSSVKDFNRILDNESKKSDLGSNVTMVKLDDNTSDEKNNIEDVENIQPNSNSNSNCSLENKAENTIPKQTDYKDDMKSAPGSPPSTSCDLEVLHESVKWETSKLNSRVKRLPRKELEKIILHLFTEKVLYQCELGRQKQWCEKLENTLEVNRKKTMQFHKEIEDLKKVTNKLAQEQAARKGQYVAPIRIKRSVGIQAAPHIINKGLQHAQTNNSGVKTIAPRTSLSPMKQGLGNPGRVQSSPNVTFNTKMIPGNPPMHASGTMGLTTQPASRTQTIGGNPTLLNAAMPVGTVPRPAGGGGQMLMMTQPSSGVMQAIPRPTTSGEGFAGMVRVAFKPGSQNNLIGHRQMLANKALIPTNAVSAPQISSGIAKYTLTEGRAAGSRPSTVMPTPGTLVKVPVTGTTQLVAIQPSAGVVLLPNASSGATLVVSQVPAVQTVNSPIVAQSRSSTSTSAPRVMGSSFRPIPAPSLSSSSVSQQARHPAPLPRTQAQQVAGSAKKLPPQPSLRLSHKDNSIVLSWTMAKTDDHEPISSYQLYAYQEGTQPPSWTLWKKVGSVKALELPMACTLTQFMPGHVYHFAVRAVDSKSRLGPFSEPQSIRLEKKL